MKVIATYLPQYHRIPENDLWWGEGFTEWTNVKKAYPLYEGHCQPRVPLNQQYYDLSDGQEIINQMLLAKEYGVDCFAIYHYWFMGRQLLEKPIRIFEDTKKLPIDFCLFWANEPWTRTWDGNEHAKEILMAQQYGGTSDWKANYDYMRKYFLHENYLKKDGCPVLAIYSASEIKQLKEMLNYWNELAREDGFNGIFLITTNRKNSGTYYPTYGNATFDFEPFATLTCMGGKEKAKLRNTYLSNDKSKEYNVFDYKLFCEETVLRKHIITKNNYYGLFAGWDNTPRRKEKTELIFENNTPDVFGWFFKKQYEKALDAQHDYLFINAWNEWGEGTFLEPDELYKYGYLEAIRRARFE